MPVQFNVAVVDVMLVAEILSGGKHDAKVPTNCICGSFDCLEVAVGGSAGSGFVVSFLYKIPEFSVEVYIKKVGADDHPGVFSSTATTILSPVYSKGSENVISNHSLATAVIVPLKTSVNSDTGIQSVVESKEDLVVFPI